MAFREISVVQIKEALRLWLKGAGERTIAQAAGIDRKTVRRYIESAKELGLERSGDEGQITDVLIGQLVERVRPHRPDGHGESWRVLLGEEERIKEWLASALNGSGPPNARPRRCASTIHRPAVNYRLTSDDSDSWLTVIANASVKDSSSPRASAATSSCGRPSSRRPKR